ncbi:MAG: glycosyltransferase family 39 protein [Anaerolineaceae bacterium]|nr:glycosyltransferase family 39 protein [Anaerolineaceae bacterium]
MKSGNGTPESVALESLTLDQLPGRLLRRPRHTLAALLRIVNQGPGVSAAAAPGREPAPARPGPAGLPRLDRDGAGLIARLLALALALWGSHRLVSTSAPVDETLQASSALLLLAGMVLWLLADWLRPWPLNSARESLPLSTRQSAFRRRPQHRRRLTAATAALCCVLAWYFTAGNRFTLAGLVAWLVSMALWCYALLPANPPLRDTWRRFRVAVQGQRWQGPELVALLLILLLAAGMRLIHLDEIMPEMSSDHVEKIRDAWRVSQGNYHVFFANIGGREPFQMYAMALLADVPGFGFNFYTLKFLSAVEGIVAVLLIVLAARTVIGGREGRLAAWLTGALVAVSYWHLVLSRMGLRIVLTTAVVALLLLFLYRALRHNRRGDFLAAGLVTGLGLYTYQATRMLPLVILAAVALALLQYPARQRLALIRNLAALVLIAGAAFVPLGGYALEFPQDFWRRTTSRVLGDEAIRPDGSDTATEQLANARAILLQLGENLRNALLMFNVKGDVAWINGAPGRPALDPWTGALFVLGLVAWARRIQRQRSVLLLLLPLALVILLLPSALALSFPRENPSHTRASGALPLTLMIAALPLAQLVDQLRHALRGRPGTICAAGLVLMFALGALQTSQHRYFDENLRYWRQATFDYSTAGQALASFVEVNDAPGNAFVIAWPHWWDHRAVGIEAGLMEWPNGLHGSGNLPQALEAARARDGPYRLRADAGLLFFLSPEDEASLEVLRALFPTGLSEHRLSELKRHEFLLYRAPAPDAVAGQGTSDEQP